MVTDLYTFGCMKHHRTLVGTPKFIVHHRGATIVTWEVDLTEMHCVPEEPDNRECSTSWRVGRV